VLIPNPGIEKLGPGLQSLQTQLAIKWRFKFPPDPTSASTLGPTWENRTNEICIEMNDKRQRTGDQIA